jgi:hypothetical protein
LKRIKLAEERDAILLREGDAVVVASALELQKLDKRMARLSQLAMEGKVAKFQLAEAVETIKELNRKIERSL